MSESEKSTIELVRALHGHDSPETAYLVEDYPYGYSLRCQIRYWIETAQKGVKKGQQRVVSQSGYGGDPYGGLPVLNLPLGCRAAGRLHRPPSPRNTMHPDQPDAATPDVPTRIIDGVTCTTRAGIALLAGWPAGNTVNVKAGTDSAFPVPLPKRYDRKLWYPLEGENGVHAYLEVLATRPKAQKPPPVKPGDPEEPLTSQQAAEELGIKWSTFRFYVRLSRPIWDGEKQGRPILPKPDGPGLEWRRGTLAAHQETRPGKGRPRKT